MITSLQRTSIQERNGFRGVSIKPRISELNSRLFASAKSFVTIRWKLFASSSGPTTSNVAPRTPEDRLKRYQGPLEHPPKESGNSLRELLEDRIE
jgi:hypothetical protein